MMAKNKDKILMQYSSGKERGRPTSDRNTSLEFHYTKKHLEGFVKPDDKVLEVGCGTGYYGLYFADKCSAYHGIDIVPIHIELFERAIKDRGYANVTCELGDATNLDTISDSSYDVVLCLGPLYHLPQHEREFVFSECKRVCKDGGILAFSYINKIGVYACACIYDSTHYPNETANELVLLKGEDDLRPDTFFYTTPEEIKRLAQKHGLSVIKNLGTDFFIALGIVNTMTDEQFEIMRPLYDQMTTHESCTGMSNHALILCKK